MHTTRYLRQHPSALIWHLLYTCLRLKFTVDTTVEGDLTEGGRRKATSKQALTLGLPRPLTDVDKSLVVYSSCSPIPSLLVVLQLISLHLSCTSAGNYP